jgi:hypothetical protein
MRKMRWLALALVMTAAAAASATPTISSSYCHWQCGLCGTFCPCDACKGPLPVCPCG